MAEERFDGSDTRGDYQLEGAAETGTGDRGGGGFRHGGFVVKVLAGV